ncbi:MAG: HAMP domain-containing histidine kinase [Lentimicrobiaceae bacterium]|nr:HAMP domain-containing histidine kinase [Lentimicrobiaceae bacterium]HPG33097.1 HAMP domain-containing sensor histidine kinase [Lentimicrobium sp.]
MEQELSDTKKDCKQSEQLLAEEQLKEINLTKNKFFSIIAHDLRSPFTSILGFARLLQDEYDDFSDDERKMMIGQILDSTESTYQLLDNLLAWTKSQLGKTIFNPETFTLNSLILESVKQTISQAKIKQITISTSYTENISLTADLNMMRTVLRNLLSNAIKFSYPGSEIKLNAETENNMLTISVADFGTGMTEDVRQSLFKLNENLPTTKGTANEKGTGLGLILCREFMEKNGGTIAATSEVGKGSTFSISLPISPAE